MGRTLAALAVVLALWTPNAAAQANVQEQRAASAERVLAAPIRRIALLGCIKQKEPIPALQAYVTARPDLSLWLGDNIYVDTQDNPALIGQGYAALARAPGFAELRSIGQHMFIWDDHDYGDNNAGGDYPLKAQSTEYFTQFWGHGAELPHPDDGVYYNRVFSFEGKRLHVIMLDVRSHRDAPDGQGDILGARQWAWLEGALQVEADLTLLVSGSQILLDKETGSETWEHYPRSVSRLYDLIRRSRQDRLLFITGDQHYAETARHRGILDLDAIEFQFAGLNQTEEPELNLYRDSPTATSLHSIGLIDIQWSDDAVNKAHIVYRAIDTATGNTEFTYRVNFDDIVLRMQFPSDRAFIGDHSVEIKSEFPRLDIRYTIDGKAPDTASPLYSGPIAINASRTVTAAYFDPAGFKRSRDFVSRYEATSPRASIARTPNMAPGLRYRYDEGQFMQVPALADLPRRPKATGVSADLSVARIAQRPDHFSVWFEGLIEAPQTGLYRLSVTSDDGALVYLGDDLIVDNDGSHAARTRTGLAALAQGLHPIRIGYFEDYAGHELSLRLERVERNVPQEIALNFSHVRSR